MHEHPTVWRALSDVSCPLAPMNCSLNHKQQALVTGSLTVNAISNLQMLNAWRGVMTVSIWKCQTSIVATGGAPFIHSRKDQEDWVRGGCGLGLSLSSAAIVPVPVAVSIPIAVTPVIMAPPLVPWPVVMPPVPMPATQMSIVYKQAAYAEATVVYTNTLRQQWHATAHCLKLQHGRRAASTATIGREKQP